MYKLRYMYTKRQTERESESTPAVSRRLSHQAWNAWGPYMHEAGTVCKADIVLCLPNVLQR